ncbi:Inherit from euNOG: PLAC8 family [Seminavis robusta]|uniref:Inherit from euNOG: PLAC8 family n=1 Tax=Seminavis robusta TaxID=568900 RepID=A0A9N8DC96_9STRA|nr:Inherit from euNOG: PLAC8 family [Seminavis robusta]|eukprot:Sro13_g010290.1 Inherit from euNOG: PLAC8 family (217) ;mRNA; f:170962-171612
MVFCCFSSKPLASYEVEKGKYGAAYAPFLGNQSKFDISLCEAPCREPGCLLATVLCFCPIQVHMRHKALNHVDPGSGWANYKCCQGYFGGCCCLQPGQMGEQSCPSLCMCVEASIFPGPAVSATSNIVREAYRLGLDEDDVRLIRCNNCLFVLSCILNCIAPLTDCEGDDVLAHIVNVISDITFCCVSGCMTAQVHHEIKLREQHSAPTREEMERC